MQFGDPRLAGDRQRLARRSGRSRRRRTRAPKARPISPSDSALANRPSIRLVVHRPKASETRPPRPVQRTPARLKRQRLRRPDFCAASTSRSASSIGVCRGFGRDRIVLRLDDCGRGERRGAVVDGDARIVEAEGARAGRALGHASRSPIRNCRARSSRICGGSGCRRASGDRRPEAHEAPVGVAPRPARARRREDRRGSAGKFAGKDRRLGLAVERLAADRLARVRRADDGVEDFAVPCRISASRVARMAASAMTSILAPTPSARAMALGGQSAAGSPRAGRGWCGAGGRPWSRRTGSGRCAGGTVEAKDEARPARKAESTSASACSRSLSAAGPEFSARRARRPARSAGRAGRNGRGRTA